MNEIVPNPAVPLPIPLEELEGDRELGGKLTMRDIAIPYLYILQGLSPQVQPASPKFIKGAAISQFLLTVLDEVYDGTIPLPVIPCFFERVVNEWVPREKGGGLVATYNPESDILSKAKRSETEPGKVFLSNGNLVVETAYHYLLVKRPTANWVYAIFPLKSTHLKHSATWNNLIETKLIPGTGKIAPRFLFQYQVTTMPETRADKIWYSPKFKEGPMIEDRELYFKAKEYAKIAATGMLRRPMEEDQQEQGGEQSSPI